MEIKCGYLCSGNINIFDRAMVIRKMLWDVASVKAPVGVLRSDRDVL